ncbi:MAG: succinate dehydrogenase, cytochrome b556 subunit [Methylophilales bacterium]|nr:succinate dehydrogenase, cytochrome b556 subunit [Methylophilales bacterium]
MAKQRPISRPKNLNLLSIRLPINALVSILHRVSGFLLFLVLPLVLWCLQTSFQSTAGFEQVQALLAHPLPKLILLSLAWAFFHHFLAGLRHLAMDVHWGTKLASARITSKLVMFGGLLLTLLLAMQIC